MAQAKAQLHMTMPEVADSPEFLGLLRFVVNLGAQQGGFIAYLKTFVGLRGGNRQVKSATISAAGTLGPTVPHLMVGLVLMAFTAPPAFFVDGFSKFLSTMDARGLLDAGGKTPSAKATQAEEILRWFHRIGEDSTKKSALSGPRIEFLALLDATVCRFITGKHLGKLQDECRTIEDVAEVFRGRMLEQFPELSAAAALARPWKTPEPNASKPVSNGPADLAPKVIVFKDGLAVTSQEVYRETVLDEIIDWASTIAYPKEELAKAHVVSLLRTLSEFLRPAAAAAVIVRRTGNNDVAVLAKKDIAAGSIAFAPSVPSISAISVPKEGSKPPPGVVRVHCMGVPLLISPCTRLRPIRELPANWKKKEFVDPFWVMARTTIAGMANCGFAEVAMEDLVTIRAGAADLKLAKQSGQQTETSMVPVIFPFRDIAKGDELIMETVASKKAVKPPVEVTWENAKRLKVT